MPKRNGFPATIGGEAFECVQKASGPLLPAMIRMQVARRKSICYRQMESNLGDVLPRSDMQSIARLSQLINENLLKDGRYMPNYTFEQYIRIVRPLPKYVKRDIYGIPVVEANSIDISRLGNGMSLISLHNAKISDPYARRKIVHAFRYDDELYRAYNHPLKTLNKVGSYYAVSTLDFSLAPEMDRQTIIQCTYQNRWYGAFLQSYGKAVIPSIGWVGREYYNITFSGLVDGGVFIISTLGTRNQYGKDIFLEGYWELRKRFPNTKIICVGNYYPEMKGDVCLIPYNKSFGSSNAPYWQPSMVNWDMTLAVGGEE